MEEKKKILTLDDCFTSTPQPDLPLRIKYGIPFTPYVRATFYVPESPVGYIDYPFADIPVDQVSKLDGNGVINDGEAVKNHL